MPGLGASFGRGAATNYQQDMANSDCILFMGSNMAEAQPVGFRWPMEAKAKGATCVASMVFMAAMGVAFWMGALWASQSWMAFTR